MKWSNTKAFIYSLLPDYFKINDTYKNTEGKGILERFISVCSEYFDTQLIQEIDDIDKLQDIDKTSPLFLNYLWEFLGYIPYAYGVVVKGENPSKEDIEKYLSEDLRYLPVDSRSILKYAISLYKIRCTDKFYEVLGRMYGISIRIFDPTISNTQTPDNLGLSEYSAWNERYDHQNRYDDPETNYDNPECFGCTSLQCTVGIPQEIYDLAHSKGIDDTKIHSTIINLINYYLPISARPITLLSVDITNSVPIDDTMEVSSGNTTITYTKGSPNYSSISFITQ